MSAGIIPSYIVASVGTQTSVISAAVDTTILLANSSRLGSALTNDSTAILYLLVASGTSSTTNYTVKLAPGAYYEVPLNYVGIIKGIWSAANGSARVTEWTA